MGHAPSSPSRSAISCVMPFSASERVSPLARRVGLALAVYAALAWVPWAVCRVRISLARARHELLLRRARHRLEPPRRLHGTVLARASHVRRRRRLYVGAADRTHRSADRRRRRRGGGAGGAARLGPRHPV